MYLGVILDTKHTWNPHVEKVIKKATVTMWHLWRALGSNWGFKPHVMKWLYTAVIRPKICYGSLVWWPAVKKVSVSRKLASLQRLACLAITGVMRTTPSIALNVLLGVPELSLWIRRESVAVPLRMGGGSTKV